MHVVESWAIFFYLFIFHSDSVPPGILKPLVFSQILPSEQ